MKKLFNFKSVRTKIIFGFSIVIVLTLLLSVLTINSMNQSNKQVENLINNELELLILDEQLASNMASRTGLIRAYLLFDEKSFMDEFQAGTVQSQDLVKQAREISDSTKLDELINQKVEWEQLTDKVFSEYSKGNKEEALEIMKTTVGPLGRTLITEFDDLAKNREAKIEKLGDNIQENGKQIIITSIITFIVVLILGVITAFITSRSIVNPIKTVMEQMQKITSGNLNNDELHTDSKDELGQLIHATNGMNNSMRNIMLTISEVTATVSAHSEELTQSANEVRSGTEQISTTMEELATGSESQANMTTDLSTMMKDYTEKIEQTTENTERATNESNQVLVLADEGTELMNASMKQMENIDSIVQDSVEKVQDLDEQSREISKLVVVIQDIADQTNLLALNAAIEAARAGEQGRGFAVVADEVRKLAEQVGNSVTDISTIVGSIQNEINQVTNSLNDGYKEVELGTNQIRLTNEKFSTIQHSISEAVNSINFINTNMADIAASSQEMNSSIYEIAAISEQSAAGIEQTSASSQQTSSAMEEVAGSANELSKLAEELNGLVSNFKL
ncbi:methyl-accepting chemotaxis protein [Bacilli bacterium]|uniref:methyl-accepting chemotaxis protein n=1 Tax=Oceanobacillus caeni TaxID=405946 RepID=UPI000621D9CD|nr:HAMP domain-containing methyl-accepting chemotaxis protein [Oceanobacillus caeni]KKE80255.1 chemotaxis protein [Bacilli bacterium VT-13-104]PZD87984.1 methyl-accepting chemotaxis protein [Bacilli bacterium]MBU8789394.1 methyl-accepting chemotaxis protein [Oceanobacillus caeni]PZD90175.1 methyl-accepting chemotaxis protein [Bacilli bacterium]PZD92069.1 methyl-accepting chemotaxis protein [Bacilli bacterium]